MMKKDPTEWRKKFDAWKNGTPTSELFNLPKYDDGTDDNQPVVKYYTEKDLDKLFDTYNAPFVKDNNIVPFDRDDWNSNKNDPEMRKDLTKWINELVTDNKVSVNGGELKNVVVTPTKEDKKILRLLKHAVPDKNVRNDIYERFDRDLEWRASAGEKSNISQNEKVKNLVSVWQMSKNPKIYNNVVDKFITDSKLGTRRANYTPILNKFGNIANLDDYVSELSHAYQFSPNADKQVRENILSSFLNLPGDISINGKSGYKRPGNLEHTAHSIIQPALENFIMTEKHPSVQALNDRINKRLQWLELLRDGSLGTKSTFFKSIKPLPKYDTGTDNNPWIPKGIKVPTENGKEVAVSAQPKTTAVSKQRPSIDDNLTEQQRGQAYLRQLYKVDKPLSGEDPIGELAVEGAASGPVFKGLGWVGKQIAKQAMPYIGRALKPVTNWFAAKALSNSIDDAVATPTFSKVLPATEQLWQNLNLPRRSYQSGSMRGPFTEELFRRNGVFDAFDAFDNPARKQLIDRLSEEAGFPLQISTGHGKFPGTIKILTDSDADKILGKNVFGKRDGYTLYVRESADPTTMFHEALHLQGFGNVDWDFPKLQSLLDDYEKKGLKVAQLEKSGAPFMQIRDAKRDYYAAEQAYKQLFEQKTATEQFLKQKVESVLRDDAEEYIRQPHEFVVHGLQAGRKVGLKPYQPEPMYDPYNTGVPIVDFGKIMETVHSAIKKHNWMADLKLDTPQDYHNAWKVLTGNFLPAAVITGGTFGALQEHDKGKSIKPVKKRK